MSQSVDETVRAMRIVVGGLIGGLASFGALAAVLGPLSPSFDPNLGRWMLVGIVLFGLGSATAYFTFRRSLMAKLATRAVELRQQSDPSVLILADYRGFTVVAGGLIDGPGFFAAITYLQTGNPLALGALGIALALLVAHLPSAGAIRRLAEAAAQS
jgi:hypothetical protein